MKEEGISARSQTPLFGRGGSRSSPSGSCKALVDTGVGTGSILSFLYFYLNVRHLLDTIMHRRAHSHSHHVLFSFVIVSCIGSYVNSDIGSDIGVCITGSCEENSVQFRGRAVPTDSAG
jgi:hypothetical protein